MKLYGFRGVQASLLSRCPTAVDENRVTRDERGGWRCQKYYGTGHFHRLADAMQAGDALDHVGTERRIGKRFVGSRRRDKRRSDGVYGDLVLAPFNRQTLGEVRDPRLA